MNTTEIELWAQRGIDKLTAPYTTGVRSQTLEQVPISADEALALLRAAYAGGYQAALTDDPPLEIPEACRRMMTLLLLVPV